MPRIAQHHALSRQWEVLRLLPTKPPGITARDLANLLERVGFKVTKRTLERDLSELSTIFGIVCNDKGTPYGWHWMKGGYAELVGLSVSDAVSLRVVEDLLRPLLPTAVLESLEGRFEQAKSKLSELSNNNPNAKWAEKVRYVSPSLPLVPPQIDSSMVDTVHEAIVAERQIEVGYRKASGEQIDQLRLHPLALIQRGQITYLVATAYEYSDIRLYALHRINKACELPDAARFPGGFSLDAYMESGVLQFGSGHKIDFEARVGKELADVLSETPLGRDQKLVAEGGSYRVYASLTDSWQLEWWLLSQGADIEVVQPLSLRERVANRLVEACSMYQRNAEDTNASSPNVVAQTSLRGHE